MKHLFFLILLLVNSAHANTVFNGGKVVGKVQTLKFAVGVDPKLKKVTDGIIDSAIALVTAVGSERVKLIRVEPEIADFYIEVTDRTAALKASEKNPKLWNFTNGLNGDAYTVYLTDGAKSVISVRVLFDEAAYLKVDGKFIPRDDAFARIVTLLGHEIYGNVLNFITHGPNYDISSSLVSQKEAQRQNLETEINAFATGVEFLNLLISKFGKVLPAKLTTDFSRALEREEGLLTQYHAEIEKLRASDLQTVNQRRVVRSCHTVF